MTTICIRRMPLKVEPFVGLPERMLMNDDELRFVWVSCDELEHKIDVFGDRLMVRAR